MWAVFSRLQSYAACCVCVPMYSFSCTVDAGCRRVFLLGFFFGLPQLDIVSFSVSIQDPGVSFARRSEPQLFRVCLSGRSSKNGFFHQKTK